MNAQTSTFEKFESSARSYCRSFPVVFTTAKNSYLNDENGVRYIDFLCGAGAINYGHNNEHAKRAVLEYMSTDSILMSLDLHSTSKRAFIDAFQSIILEPRGYSYRMQFTSPTGTSVVESSIKLARKVTGRQNVIAFTNAYHGMSGVSLSLTGNRYHRQSISYGSVTRLPYDRYVDGLDSAELLRQYLRDPSSGVDHPAAVILESIQGEGGLNVASVEWMRKLRDITQEYGIPLIFDEVQAGCGRSGRFFSFERAGIEPDMVCLSKSIGGLGLPMAVLLIKSELDKWRPGEDNGTFRGNNLAFVAATEVLQRYWRDDAFQKALGEKETILRDGLADIAKRYPQKIKGVRGIGLMQGLEFHSGDDTSATIAECFAHKLVVESCGAYDQVLKIMPALTIEPEVLRDGIAIIAKACHRLFADSRADADIGAVAATV
ncbi:MAG: diaminobutyrate--2-oxoglutarate transaminase [Xanthomonadales bacterium]|nr:diaminobutyrate--2-oxoglutarate transaminase [Xanthomonadales bacterium]